MSPASPMQRRTLTADEKLDRILELLEALAKIPKLVPPAAVLPPGPSVSEAIEKAAPK